MAQGRRSELAGSRVQLDKGAHHRGIRRWAAVPTVIKRRSNLAQQITPRQRECFPLPIHEHAAPATLVVNRDDCASQTVERGARLQSVHYHAAADLVLSRVDSHVVRCPRRSISSVWLRCTLAHLVVWRQRRWCWRASCRHRCWRVQQATSAVLQQVCVPVVSSDVGRSHSSGRDVFVRTMLQQCFDSYTVPSHGSIVEQRALLRAFGKGQIALPLVME